MKLDLKDIIEIPGGSIPFECDLDTADLDFPGVAGFPKAPHAEGKVVNTAGVLTLKGVLTADMDCICDRCCKPFSRTKTQELEVALAAGLEDDENPDIFPLDGDALDLDEVLRTCFILDMDLKFLCRPDCAGLCPKCGADLNLGPCSCKKEVDPRMAVLEQLLDKD